MTMVSKTYSLSQQDEKKLISYACRYRRIQTNVDENHNTMTIYTTFADNDQPTSIADELSLTVLNDSPPKMPQEEYQRRVQGTLPEE